MQNSTLNGPKWEPHENELWLFLDTKMNVTNSYSEKSRWKTGSFVKFPFVFPELRSLTCPKKCILQFCADLSKKTKFVKAI